MATRRSQDQPTGGNPLANPERSIKGTAHAITSGQSFGRRLTQQERRTLAIAATSPKKHLTVHSKDLSRTEMAAKWELFVKRINSDKTGPGPLIYVTTLACSAGASRYHLHALLWDQYLHYPIFHKAARELGLGKPKFTPIPTQRGSCETVLRMTAYVLGQHEQVFGNAPHKRHDPLPKHGRRLLKPQGATLQRWQPEVFEALRDADCRSISDFALGQRLSYV